MTTIANPRTHQRRPHVVSERDRGVTFIELLVAIVLLGVVVVAVLTALRTAIVATGVDEQHAKAYAWLQSAQDEITATPYQSCASSTNAQIVTAYQAAADTAQRPDGWTAGTITVASVQYLSRNGAADQWTSTTCAAGNANSPVYPQLVTIEVESPDASFTRTIEVIKSV